jgi:hypothetical protein
MAFSARHSSGAGVPRHVHSIGCSFAVGAIRPRAWQLPVFVTMLGTRFHSTVSSSVFAVLTVLRSDAVALRLVTSDAN